jgi:hypothetical protein
VMETTEKLPHIEVTGNNLFYCSLVSWLSPKAHTHTHTHTFTSFRLPWYFRKIRVDKFFLSYFNHALPKIQIQADSAWIQGRNWLPKMHRATKLS